MLTFPLQKELETKEILKKSIKANAALAKLTYCIKISQRDRKDWSFKRSENRKK